MPTQEEHQEREAFEKWAKPRGYEINRASNGPYIWDATDDAWKIWQARAALAVRHQEQPVAWRVKLAGDEWTIITNEWFAKETAANGNLPIEPLFTHPAQASTAQRFMVTSINHKAGIVTLCTLNAEDVQPPLESGQEVTLSQASTVPTEDELRRAWDDGYSCDFPTYRGIVLEALRKWSQASTSQDARIEELERLLEQARGWVDDHPSKRTIPLLAAIDAALKGTS
jgi:hypothetical protein